MNKGGYQIVDLLNNNITTEGTQFTIKGIYNLIKNSIKPIYLSGITIENIEQQDRYVIPVFTPEGITISITDSAGIYVYNLEIRENDLIVITGA